MNSDWIFRGEAVKFFGPILAQLLATILVTWYIAKRILLANPPHDQNLRVEIISETIFPCERNGVVGDLCAETVDKRINTAKEILRSAKIPQTPERLRAYIQASESARREVHTAVDPWSISAFEAIKWERDIFDFHFPDVRRRVIRRAVDRLSNLVMV